MSPVELLAAVAPAAPQPASGGGEGAPDAFGGLLAAQERPAARGRLGLGGLLREPLRQPRPDETGEAINAAGLGFLGRLILDARTPGGAGAGQPGPTERPLILPGQADQPLILPGEAVTTAKGAAGPQVLPGETPVGDKAGQPVLDADVPVGPTVLPQVLAELAEGQAGPEVMALAAGQAARRAVGEAPATLALPEAPPALPTEEEAPVHESGTAGLHLTPSGQTATAQPTAATAQAASPAAEAAQARPAAVDPAADPAATDGGFEDPTVETAAGAPRPGEAPQLVRSESAAVQRLSFDAVTQVAAQIIRRLEGRSTRFEVELRPADLGRIDVRLDIDAEGRVAARLAFDNPVAATDLRGRADELRRSLEEAGFQLAEDALSFSDREEGDRGRSFDADRDPFARSARAAEQADAESQPVLRTLARMGLDVRI